MGSMLVHTTHRHQVMHNMQRASQVHQSIVTGGFLHNKQLSLPIAGWKMLWCRLRQCWVDSWQWTPAIWTRHSSVGC